MYNMHAAVQQDNHKLLIYMMSTVNPVNIGSGYGLVLLKHQSIIWTNLNKWASLSL